MEQRRKNYDEAVEHFKTAFSLNEKFGGLSNDNLSVAHISLGHCYGWLKQNDNAIQEYEKACQLGAAGSLLETHNNLGNLYLMKALDSNDGSWIAKAQAHFGGMLNLVETR